MIPNQQRKRAAVIGAGPGGLAAAMLLSGQDMRLMYTRNSQPLADDLPVWSLVNISLTAGLPFDDASVD